MPRHKIADISQCHVCFGWRAESNGPCTGARPAGLHRSRLRPQRSPMYTTARSRTNVKMKGTPSYGTTAIVRRRTHADDVNENKGQTEWSFLPEESEGP